MAKALRHRRIAELVEAHVVRNQLELQELLAAEGIDVTQATLSRDLRELEVVKGPSGYLPGAEALGRGSFEGERDGTRLARALRGELLQAEAGGSMVVLRTRAGHANALAIEIDRARPDGVLGTIAGDDTVFVAASSERRARSVLRRFRELAGHN